MRKIKQLSVIAVVFLLLVGVVWAVVYQLSQSYFGVQTSVGLRDLPSGTLIGGDPVNFITLQEAKTMQTTTGNGRCGCGMIH